MAIVTPLGRTTSNLLTMIGTSASLRTRNSTGSQPSCDLIPLPCARRIAMNGARAFFASERSIHCQRKAMKPGTATRTGQPNDHTTDQSIDARNSPMLREWHGVTSGVHSSQENA